MLQGCTVLQNTLVSHFTADICFETPSEDEAVSIADSIGYPVVMKMTSKTTSHKTDVGGVRVNIQSAEQLRAEYQDLIAKLTEKGLLEGLEGVIIQEMVKGSREMVCGIATDPQYGPMMMFGLGGVFIEVMKDVTFRIAPLTDMDAKDMIKSVKAYKLLQGARGTTPAQMEQIEETLLRLSQLVSDFKFIDELDINPLLISEKTGEGIAVDGRIKVRMSEAQEAVQCLISLGVITAGSGAVSWLLGLEPGAMALADAALLATAPKGSETLFELLEYFLQLFRTDPAKAIEIFGTPVPAFGY